MTITIIITLIILLGAVVLFATELLPVDVTAMLIISGLVLSGILTPQEGIAGFSNTAVATVAAMFVLSAGIERSGALNPVTLFLEKLFRRNYWLGIISMLVFVAFLSAFINNTPVVALFIPVVLSCARSIRASPEKLLIPLSFASIFGGTCTLIGTSTNILVSDYAEANGLGAFGMFEMTKLGLVFLVAGIIYLLVIGLRLLPERPGGSAHYEDKYHLSDYITNVVLLKGAASIGKSIRTAPLVADLALEIIQIKRGNRRFFSPPENFTLEEGDTLKVMGNLDKIRKLKRRKSVAVRPLLDRELSVDPNSELVLHEVVVLPNSELSGVKLNDIDFEARFGAYFLGVRGRKGLITKQISHWKLAAGDCLLLTSPRDKSEIMHKNFPDLFVINHSDQTRFSSKEALLASGTVIAVMLTATLNILPIVTASLLGCLLLIMLRIVSPEDAYKSISWKVILLLAGSLSLGAALEKTGAAQLLADQIINLGGAFGPVVVLSALYLIATLLTSVMSNNATVVVLAPIVISLANSMQASPKPFLMAITFAASASFMTPIGYQTNTMVYAAGNYSFRDFFRVGAPLNLLFWLLASLLIPVLFPL
ncbi:MAG: anion permease [Lewinellaceae bacterium]|nr:anion permease [Saprospiraceae bacterium]MCB9315613.1 anion permease [Lewinellaceae bacterium]MCB9332067.1 anion permease [Lewinellaceae bacterium]